MRFRESSPFTIGVELELQLLDRETLELKSASPQVIERLQPRLGDRVKRELIQSMVELTTPVCRSVAEVEEELRSAIVALEEVAEDLGLVIYAASLHPFSLHSRQEIFDDRRYRVILEELQLLGRRLITQGLHVHIGMPSAGQAMKVFDAVRRYLPILLALSASSPFYEGEDTGLASYRTKLFSALPRSGMPGALGTWDHFVSLVETLKGAGIIDDVRELWWDVRPHPYFGTVEVRICDLPVQFDEILALVAAIQALVAYLAEEPPPGPMLWYLIKGNKWQATRYGLQGRFVDPVSQRIYGMREAVLDLVRRITPVAKRFGSFPYLEPIGRILKEGCGAQRQRRVYRRSGSFQVMIDTMRKRFWRQGGGL